MRIDRTFFVAILAVVSCVRAEELSTVATADLIAQYEKKPSAEVREELLSRHERGEKNGFIEGLRIAQDMSARGGYHLERFFNPVSHEVFKAAAAPEAVRALNARLRETLEHGDDTRVLISIHIFDILSEVGDRSSIKAVAAAGYTFYSIRPFGMGLSLAKKLGDKYGVAVDYDHKGMKCDLFTADELAALDNLRQRRRKATDLYGLKDDPNFPAFNWTLGTPAESGLNAERLKEISQYLNGDGCIVRDGCVVYHWGAWDKRADVASAAKPWFSTFLFLAVEAGELPGLDEPAAKYWPPLNTLNEALGFKDRQITFRHLANQISCYGAKEGPGAAFDYNDFQTALFWDILFLKVYRVTYANVDSAILNPLLCDFLQCEDQPTFMAFKNDREGRLAVSPRDFARFGLLFLNKGNWRGKQIISAEHAAQAVGSPLPLTMPRTAGDAAGMIRGQRTLGSKKVPDNQCDHDGCYSWMWWVNGVRRNGQRKWPDAAANVFAALGHENGKRGIAVIPDQKIVISWNNSDLDKKPAEPHPLNEVFRLLKAADERK